MDTTPHSTQAHTRPETLPSPCYADGAPLPTVYRVRDVVIDPAVVLAPMEGVTDRVFRRLIRSIGGPGLTYTEFIASRNLRMGHKRAWQMAALDPDERPIALQIYGREPEVMAEAAKMLQDHGATILDINMGCPSKKVCANSGGSALMRDPDVAVAIVRAVRAAITIPLTVKMRSGFDATLRNAPELAWRCQEEGAEAITIHWRTRADGYQGERAVDKIAETVDRVDVPVIANGDVVDIPSAHAMFQDTGCAGVMIGRGAVRNPWVLKQVGQWLRGEQPLVVDAAERRRVLMMYYDTITDFIPNAKGALGRMKMVTKYFTEPLPLGDGLRARVLRSQERSEVIAQVEAYFARLARFEAGAQDAFVGSGFETVEPRRRRRGRAAA